MISLLSADTLRAARALAGLSQREAASRASITQRAVWLAESDTHISLSTNAKLRAFYENMGIEFLGSVDMATGLTSGLGARWRTPPQLPILSSTASSYHADRTGVAFGAARALLNKKQSEISYLSNLPERKVGSLEAGALADHNAITHLRSFYEREKIAFLGWGDVTSGLFYGVGVRWRENDKAVIP